MGYRVCEKCHGTGKVNSMVCPLCEGKGKIRYVFSCPVCNGRYYVPRDPPIRVRCPHCNSLLLTNWDSIYVIERGAIPIPPPGSKFPLGAIGGGALGLVIGGPIGGLIGLLIGGMIGLAADAPLEAREG
jgi:RNA polymerase subunit RPABC4/transcription elongation factor Spt4